MSLKIKNNTFLYYLFSAASSFGIDLILFTIFNIFLSKLIGYEAIIVSTVLARILSSLYNYLINSRVVFQKYSQKMFIKYYILVIIQMIISSVSVYLINKFLINIFATIIKLFVDLIIFVVNYFVQKKIIFK